MITLKRRNSTPTEMTADVQQVFTREIIWRTDKDGKAKDDFGQCAHRQVFARRLCMCIAKAVQEDCFAFPPTGDQAKSRWIKLYDTTCEKSLPPTLLA
jgi:hypothetical protein